tara:strand:- start:18040 stop:18255 length:216 start_codon:yes stop_codon:yes gene_type:complete
VVVCENVNEIEIRQMNRANFFIIDFVLSRFFLKYTIINDFSQRIYYKHNGFTIDRPLTKQKQPLKEWLFYI